MHLLSRNGRPDYTSRPLLHVLPPPVRPRRDWRVAVVAGCLVVATLALTVAIAVVAR